MGPDPYQKEGDKIGAMALVKTPPMPDNTAALVDDIKVKTGQWINKGQLVLVLKTKDKNNQEPNDFKTRRIKSEASGKVLEICVKKGEETKSDSILARISLTGCPHSTIMKNMCADCGADLEHEEQRQGISLNAFTCREHISMGIILFLIYIIPCLFHYLIPSNVPRNKINTQTNKAK